MPRRTIRMLTAVTTIALCAAATTASAQPQTTSAPDGRRFDVSAGYQVLHIPDETFPFGLNFDVSGQLRPDVDLVGEFGFAHDQQNETGVSGTLNFLNFGGGARWHRPMGSFAPFVQLLAGGVRPGAELIVNGATFRDTDWAFMLQPGAGVVVPLAPNLGIVGQVDYRRAFFAEQGENEFRFVAGLRIAMMRP